MTHHQPGPNTAFAFLSLSGPVSLPFLDSVTCIITTTNDLATSCELSKLSELSVS